MGYETVFVLAYRDEFDYDRRFSLLTEEHGKINAICKRILKPNAKLAGHLDVPSLSWVELVWSGRGWQVTQALELESFPHLRQDPEALGGVLALASSFDRLLFAEDDHEFKGQLMSTNTDNQNQRLYLLWHDFLKTIDQYAERKTTVDYRFVGQQCLIKLLHELGFLPDTFVCAHCGKKFSSRFVTYLENQLYCDDCRKALSLVGESFPKSVLDLMRQGLSGVWFPASNYAQAYIQLAQLFERQTNLFVI